MGVRRQPEDVARQVRELQGLVETETFFTAEYQRQAIWCEAILIGKWRSVGRSGLRSVARILLSPTWSAPWFYRRAIIARAKCHSKAAAVFRRLNLALNGCDVHPEARLVAPVLFRHPSGVAIGVGVAMGSYCQLHGGYQGVWDPSDLGGEDRYPRFGEGVFVGAEAILIGDVEVGDQGDIGYLAWFTKGVEVRPVVGGLRRGVVLACPLKECFEDRGLA